MRPSRTSTASRKSATLFTIRSVGDTSPAPIHTLRVRGAHRITVTCVAKGLMRELRKNRTWRWQISGGRGLMNGSDYVDGRERDPARPDSDPESVAGEPVTAAEFRRRMLPAFSTTRAAGERWPKESSVSKPQAYWEVLLIPLRLR
jgi:hypothetical protein